MWNPTTWKNVLCNQLHKKIAVCIQLHEKNLLFANTRESVDKFLSASVYIELKLQL